MIFQKLCCVRSPHGQEEKFETKSATRILFLEGPENGKNFDDVFSVA